MLFGFDSSRLAKLRFAPSRWGERLCIRALFGKAGAEGKNVLQQKTVSVEGDDATRQRERMEEGWKKHGTDLICNAFVGSHVGTCGQTYGQGTDIGLTEGAPLEWWRQFLVMNKDKSANIKMIPFRASLNYSLSVFCRPLTPGVENSLSLPPSFHRVSSNDFRVSLRSRWIFHASRDFPKIFSKPLSSIGGELRKFPRGLTELIFETSVHYLLFSASPSGGSGGTPSEA